MSGDAFRYFEFFPSVITTEKDFRPKQIRTINITEKYFSHTFEFIENL